MGNKFAKWCKSDGKNKNKEEEEEVNWREPEPEPPPDPETEALNRARRLLHDNIQEFLLEYILMSVQFFTNFDNEIQRLKSEMSKYDKLELHQKTCFSADTLMDSICQNVKYQPKHGPNKRRRQAFQASRLYMSHDNIEIVFTEQSATENRPKTRPYYKLVIDSCEEPGLAAAGYVNLKESQTYEEERIYERLDGESPPAPKEDDDGDIESFLRNMRNTPSILNKGKEHRQSKARLSMQPRTTVILTPRPVLDVTRPSLGVPSSSSSTYGYATVQSLTRSKPLDESRMGNIPNSSSAVPRVCFRRIQVPLIKDRRRTGLANGRGALFMTFNLLESTSFMRHFCDVFAERLAEAMDFNQESLSWSTVQGWYINCPRGQDLHRIIPCIQSKEWPECGMDFTRPGTGECPWPTRAMIDCVLKQGCSVVPIGFLQRRGENPQFDMQWKMDSPLAAKYLILHTMHAHVRAYIFLVAIYKTFLEVEDNCLSLGPDHLLHLLFWEISKDFLAWPEDRPWKTLHKLLLRLNSALDKRKVKDFFFRKRNMLDSTPIMFVNKVKGILSQILESPVPHVLLALKNLHFNADFYPVLDFNKLYQLITMDNVIEYLNPLLRREQNANWTFSGDRLSNNSGDREEEDEWAEDDDFDNEKQWRLDMLRAIEAKKVAKAIIQGRTVSAETIDLSKEPKQDKLRKQEILKTFIPHYMAMAEKSKTYGADTQFKLYISHAKVLIQLLREEDGDVSEVNEFTRQLDSKLPATGVITSKKNNPIQTRQLPQVPTDGEGTSGGRKQSLTQPTGPREPAQQQQPNPVPDVTQNTKTNQPDTEPSHTSIQPPNLKLEKEPRTIQNMSQINSKNDTETLTIVTEVQLHQQPKVLQKSSNLELNNELKTSLSIKQENHQQEPKSPSATHKQLNGIPKPLQKLSYLDSPTKQQQQIKTVVITEIPQPKQPIIVINENSRGSYEDTKL